MDPRLIFFNCLKNLSRYLIIVNVKAKYVYTQTCMCIPKQKLSDWSHHEKAWSYTFYEEKS